MGCYSYLLQELIDFLSIRDSFDESQATLEKFFGLNIRPSRFEVVSRDTCTSYDEFYKQKPLPSPESELELQVVSFDGKGVPVIKRELTELKSKLGKGEKRQKKRSPCWSQLYCRQKTAKS